MKAFRSTGIFSVMVVLIAAYTAWEYHKAGSDPETPQEKKIFHFKNEDVEQFKIENKGQITLIVRDHDGWKMTQPVEDLVEPTAVDALLYSAAVQKGKVFRSDSEAKATHWAEYGLDPAGASLEIKTAKETQHLSVSTKNAFDGSFYVRFGDELMIVDHSLAQAVLRDPKGFRSRRLWRDPEASIEDLVIKIDFAGRRDEFNIVKNKEGKWSLEPAPDFAIDSGRLERWVAALEGLMPNEIADEALNHEVVRTDLLLKPSYILQAHYKKADGQKGNWILTIGQDRAEDVFMYTNQRPTVYMARVGDMTALRVDRKYFRDGKSAFHFPVEAARLIEVKDGPFKHSFKKGDLLWKLVDPTDGQELDQDKLVTMVQHLSALEAQEFLPPGSASGFSDEQQLVVRDEKGKVLFEMQWGGEYKAKQAYNKGMTFRYIKTNLEKEAMGMSAARVVSLIDKSMIKDSVKKPETKASKK